MKEALFPSHELGKIDWFFGGLFLLLCFVLFHHGDIQGVGWDSLNFLFGKPLEFYENCKKIRGGGQNMFGTPYPPTIYAIFAIWLYPFKLLGALTSANTLLPLSYVYWLKVLTSMVYAFSGIIFYRISQLFFDDEKRLRYTTMAWLTAPIALFSQIIFSQYDIFYVVFTLGGFLMFLKKRPFAAAILFGLSITFKYFPAFVFLPLLLLFEKKIFRIGFLCLIFLIPTLLIQYLYGQSPAFIEGVNNHFAIVRVFSGAVDFGGGRSYYLFVLFTILCGISYFSEIDDENLPYVASYVYLVAAILPFLFITWNPQWAMFFVPAIVLTAMIDRRCDKFFILDLVGMFCFVAYVSVTFQDNVDAKIFNGGELLGFEFKNSYKMARFFDFFEERSASVFLSGFLGYLILQPILKYRLVSRSSPLPEVGVVDYKNIRYRLYIGISIFVVPALIAVYRDYLAGKH